MVGIKRCESRYLKEPHMQFQDIYEKTDRLLRLDDVLKVVGIGKTKLYELIQQGSFPPGCSIGRARLWRWSVVQDWVRSH